MKKMSLLSMLLVVALGVSANAAVVFNPCDNLDELSAPGFASGDFGIYAGGPTGNFFQFVPRNTNGHLAKWDFADIAVQPGDTFTFDVRNVLALGTATLNGRVILDNGAGGEAIHAFTVNLLTDNWEHVTVNMPTNPFTVMRIDFAITENTKVIQLDNLTLTTVPEPLTMTLLGLGGLLLRKRG